MIEDTDIELARMVEPVIEDVPSTEVVIDEANKDDTNNVLVTIELTDALDAFNELTNRALLTNDEVVKEDVTMELARILEACIEDKFNVVVLSVDVASVDRLAIFALIVETCKEETDALFATKLDTKVETLLILSDEKVEIDKVDVVTTIPNREDASMEEAIVDRT